MGKMHKVEDFQWQVEGRNPVMEALRAGKTIEKILVAKGSREGAVRDILKIARERGIVVQEVNRKRLDSMSQTGAHQGIIALAVPYTYASVDDILERARQANELPFVVVLDCIEDPHNFGAILRTAECCGVHGIIIPKRKAVGITPTVVKASAGAVEYIPVARVTNVASTLEYLKEQGLWVVGAEAEATPYNLQDMKGPIAMVIGNEGKGLRRLVKEKCDYLVGIPMKGKINSLNASVAAAILMYEVLRQRS
ncbi:23S rRNA (guanosine(2251)-2'-O)-methyltransferase RlmB [Caldicoprobacter algeriensis]|uniref:23S rRNA (guanosine(2251)-2'-O)-methyltransferase RlmB n=1 Tax=Caldicoprobacter algeriensis TaxID=699281 RepID=UPI0020793F01|nr:23S rRNA (guanosine(2251)-2'-O)-methyltransferase RlmB [Caldicoprobacter algeriensis]MCM8900405.1 23S rRNA (guanosine(2251)-2'-O)-methyltransferase RlmB [Caldicoprobacter algeriensis]